MTNAVYGLIGAHLQHSFSPAIHAQLGDYDYRLFELTESELPDFLQNGSFSGLNVTIPYKKTAMEYCSSLTPQAQRIGCVNTIVRQPDGSLLGHNTDYDGFAHLLHSAGADIQGKKVLVLGSGGASLTVRAVLHDLHAGEVIVISRAGNETYETIHRHHDAQFIVNTTPVGMYPNVGVSPICLDDFPRCQGVFDLIYNPASTQLLLDARRLDIPHANGLGMLVAQARAAAECFTGIKIPHSRVDELTATMERATKNIILIGMPGCGKSAIGRALSNILERPFVDTDALVTTHCGCSIPDLFATRGEEQFRTMEHQMLRSVSSGSGRIIATGGGIVTRTENHDPLHENATVVFLQRPLNQLPVAGRPISQSTSLSELYDVRLPLYRAACDLEVENIGIQATAQEIIRRLAL